MIPESQPESQAADRPAIDRFILMDDGSAIAESKHGTFYAMQSFDRQGEISVPHCECKRSRLGKECRHRRKLRSRILAEGRLSRRWGQCEVIDTPDCPVYLEAECARCGEFVFEAWVYVSQSPQGNSGFHQFSVCGCWEMGGAA